MTIFQVRYVIPASMKFTTRIFGRMQARLVSSPGVTLSGDKVRFVSVELQSQANLYELVNVAAGELFEVGDQKAPQKRGLPVDSRCVARRASSASFP